MQIVCSDNGHTLSDVSGPVDVGRTVGPNMRGSEIMKLKSTFLSVIAVALSVASAATAGDWSKIRVGTEGAYPPFNYIDSAGDLKGFDIEIAEALCAKLEAECTFTTQDWDGIIPALLANKFDIIIASMSITEERKKKVDFTDKYYATPARFIARKDTSITSTNPEALAGKTLGAQSSTTHGSYLEDNYTNSDIRLYATLDEANADLAAGRLDAVMADSVVLWDWTENTEEGKCCALVGENYTELWSTGVGMAVRKSDPDLTAMFNKALAEILADGTYKAINDKYFPFSVY
jgi:polar amino acid transport system substrate-binding protein